MEGVVGGGGRQVQRLNTQTFTNEQRYVSAFPKTRPSPSSIEMALGITVLMSSLVWRLMSKSAIESQLQTSLLALLNMSLTTKVEKQTDKQIKEKSIMDLGRVENLA